MPLYGWLFVEYGCPRCLYRLIAPALHLCHNSLDMIPASPLNRVEVFRGERCDRQHKSWSPGKGGIGFANVAPEPSAIDVLIKYYFRTFDSGVWRNISTKVALKIVQELGEEAFLEPTPVSMSAANTKIVESWEPAGAPASSQPQCAPNRPQARSIGDDSIIFAGIKTFRLCDCLGLWHVCTCISKHPLGPDGVDAPRLQILRSKTPGTRISRRSAITAAVFPPISLMIRAHRKLGGLPSIFVAPIPTCKTLIGLRAVSVASVRKLCYKFSAFSLEAQLRASGRQLSSQPILARLSQFLSSPRWINPKTGNDAGMKPPAEAEEGESDNARLDGSDDSSAFSKSDSAPLSSSSSSLPDGGSDSQSPPASPPPADTPPSAPDSIANYRSSPGILQSRCRSEPRGRRHHQGDDEAWPTLPRRISSQRREHGQRRHYGHQLGTPRWRFRPNNQRFRCDRTRRRQGGRPYGRPVPAPSNQDNGFGQGRRFGKGAGRGPPNGPVQTSFLHKHDISIINVENLVTQPCNKGNQYIRAFTPEIVSVFKDIVQPNPPFRDQITNSSINQVASNVFDCCGRSDWRGRGIAGRPRGLVVDDRMRKALLVLKKELINAQLQSKLSRDVDSKITKRQREYYLIEQLKGIKKELWMESDGKDKLIEKCKERAATLKMPEPVRKVFDEEISKLAGLEPAALEANVTRNYLEWLTQIP
ncbi:hypothetical protein BD779DRAFT_330195 [Infundibulicybe gibba]|nr:hypothetical protein BD779DRAFT_330195 [Infundibulicybe gibba]